MELYDIVMKLVGPVQPAGETRADETRLKNMKELTKLIDKLLFEVSAAVPAADRPEASMKAIGIHAKKFMEDVAGRS
jgi:hypothetical protein